MRWRGIDQGAARSTDPAPNGVEGEEGTPRLAPDPAAPQETSACSVAAAPPSAAGRLLPPPGDAQLFGT